MNQREDSGRNGKKGKYNSPLALYVNTAVQYCINGYTSFFRSWRIAVEDSEILLLVSMYTLSVIHLGLLEGTFCVVPAHKEHCVCVCVCACGGDPPFSRTENYGECDDISVGVTGTKPHLLELRGSVCMCVEWKSLSPGVSRP